MSGALITGQEARQIAATFPQQYEKFLPSVLEALLQEVKKAAGAGEREYQYSKFRKRQNLFKMQRAKVVESLKKLGFKVEFTDNNMANIKVSWPE